MTVKTKKIITVDLVETNVFSRWLCTVCDGCTNPVSVLAEGKDGEHAIRVCEQCLEAAELEPDQGTYCAGVLKVMPPFIDDPQLGLPPPLRAGPLLGP